MPLLVAGLSAAIESELDSRSPAASTDDGAVSGAAERKEFADALAAAIVGYLTANAVVVGVCPTGGGPLAGGKIS